jgi:hypothetical protein
LSDIAVVYIPAKSAEPVKNPENTFLLFQLEQVSVSFSRFPLSFSFLLGQKTAEVRDLERELIDLQAQLKAIDTQLSTPDSLIPATVAANASPCAKSFGDLHVKDVSEPSSYPIRHSTHSTSRFVRCKQALSSIPETLEAGRQQKLDDS